MSAFELSSRLDAALRAEGAASSPASLAAQLKTLAQAGLARPPLPAAGATLARWRLLARVAAHDLSLVKLYEGHVDALAILAEANEDVDLDEGLAWGCWAAESPGARVVFHERGEGCVLDGTKAWCSGARHLDRGLLTVWHPDGRGPFLAAVDMHRPGIGFDGSRWRAVGMGATDSVAVRFESVPARLVGGERFYLDRPGFWQGGVGIAACWHGAACAMADHLRRQALAASEPGWHRSLALGRIDAALSANAALLREAAAWIDAQPRADAQTWALRTRAATEAVAQAVLLDASRALGAGPLCLDAHCAHLAADLPIYLRQCHGDRDLAALGECGLAQGAPAWML